MLLGVLIGAVGTVLGGLLLAGALSLLEAKPRLSWFDLYHTRYNPGDDFPHLRSGAVIVQNSGSEAAQDVVLVFQGPIMLIEASENLSVEIENEGGGISRATVESIPSRSQITFEIWGIVPTSPMDVFHSGDPVDRRFGQRMMPLGSGCIDFRCAA